jgi:RNA polymerase sigma factor (sigma-70 family)
MKKATPKYSKPAGGPSTKKFPQDYYNVLKSFQSIANKYPLLNKKEERELIEKYKDNRDELNKMLFNHNIRIVMNISRKYLQQAQNPADLLMNGAKGLMIAADKFDIDRGIKFNTYATNWVFKYVIAMFYSKSPVTGVNAVSLNSMIDSKSGSKEYIDNLTANGEGDPSSASGLYDEVSQDYLNKHSVVGSPAAEYKTHEYSDIISHVIDELKKQDKFGKLDQDIIFENIMGGVPISQISAKNNTTNVEVNKRKHRILSDMKSILSSKYKVNNLIDVM